MSNIHKDVLETIIEHQSKRIENGEKLSFEELAELIVAFKEFTLLQCKEIKEISTHNAEKALEFGNLVLDKQETIKIYDLFLRNHGLEEQFDNFYTRILRRKYRIK